MLAFSHCFSYDTDHSTFQPSILLVGGFGCVPYLRKQVAKVFRPDNGYQVYDPSHLDSGGSVKFAFFTFPDCISKASIFLTRLKAVSVGAAYSALHRDAVTARGACFHYGVVCVSSF